MGIDAYKNIYNVMHVKCQMYESTMSTVKGIVTKVGLVSESIMEDLTLGIRFSRAI